MIDIAKLVFQVNHNKDSNAVAVHYQSYPDPKSARDKKVLSHHKQMCKYFDSKGNMPDVSYSYIKGPSDRFIRLCFIGKFQL